MIVQRNCAQCGRAFEIAESRLKYGAGKHCSKICANAALRNRVEVRCATCDKTILRKPFDLVGKSRSYCSKVCADNGLVLHGEAWAICKMCGTRFAYRQSKRRPEARYCSNVCRNNGMQRPLHWKTCGQCGTLFPTQDRKRKFCGPVCLAAYHQRNVRTANCPVCKSHFTTRRAEQVYCSFSCASTVPNRVGQKANNVRDLAVCYGLELVNRNGEVVAIALVDKEDYPRIVHLRWSFSPTGDNRIPSVTARYRANGGYVTVCLHRVITRAPKGTHVDHINHDRLDNRRANLRLASAAQNAANKMPMKRDLPTGVYFMPHAKSLPWLVHLSANNVLHHKRVASLAEANAVREEWERRYHGRFAYRASLRQAPEPVAIALTIDTGGKQYEPQEF